LKFTKRKSSLLLLGAGVLVSVIYFLFLSGNGQIFEKTIMVEEENFQLYSSKPFAPQILENCKDDVHCAVMSLQAISQDSEKNEVIQTFDEILQLYRKNNPCHKLSHHMGMWFYAYLGNVTEALSYSDQVCGGGIFHGVVESYLLTEQFQGKGPEALDLKAICPRSGENPNYIEHWQCLHGLGHGLTKLYPTDVLASVKRCDEFDGEIEQLSCSKGVFMQNVADHFETGKGDFDEDDIFYPCNAVDPKRAPACYHYHVSYLNLLNDGYIKNTFDDCDKIVPQEMIKYCYYGYGREMESDIKNRVSEAVRLCTLGQKSEYHSYCLKGMLLTIVNAGTKTDRGFSFCKTLPTEFKNDCYDGIGKWIILLSKDLSGEFRRQECAKAESQQYSEICLNANLEDSLLI